MRLFWASIMLALAVKGGHMFYLTLQDDAVGVTPQVKVAVFIASAIYALGAVAFIFLKEDDQ